MIHLLGVSVGFFDGGVVQTVDKPSLRPLLLLLFIGFAIATASCACGRLGTLAQRRTMTKDAEVSDVYGVGALLRMRGVDGGFTLGWRHATYIYPRVSSDGAAEGTRWTIGWVPRHTADPFFLAIRSVGAEVAKYPAELRAHVGFRMDAFTFAACIGESRVVKFSYRPSSPRQTRLSMFPTPHSIHP